MSEPKFTPGEWRKRKVIVGATKTCHHKYNCFHFFDNNNRRIFINEANANLIQTAPEMYQMLERILDYMTGGQFLAKPPSVKEIAHLLEKARGER